MALLKVFRLHHHFWWQDIKGYNVYTEELKRKLALLTIFLLMSILASSGTYWTHRPEESVRKYCYQWVVP